MYSFRGNRRRADCNPSISLFQCHQCQDLLENNLARKRPIEVLVGKKNLEVRPLAVNKGEIVKRILYENPRAEFVFCAGDDKTDEDMFRALAPFAGAAAAGAPPIMEAPIGVTVLRGNGNGTASASGNANAKGSASASGTATPPVELAVRPDAVFSTAVGSSSKKTLARWHVTSPFEVIDAMLGLVEPEAHL